MAHIALLGDSIFDNGAYTGGAPDVVAHLRRLLPPGTTASLLAVDGATTEDVLSGQLSRVSTDVTHAVVSMGGNDALRNADVLDLPVASTGAALAMLAARVSAFEATYRRALRAIVDRAPETTACTIYNGNLPGDEGALARVGLALFNDVILRVALELQVPVIELRLVVTDPADYANAIEPSSFGARKIATSIAGALGLADASLAVHRVFGAPTA